MRLARWVPVPERARSLPETILMGLPVWAEKMLLVCQPLRIHLAGPVLGPGMSQRKLDTKREVDRPAVGVAGKDGVAIREPFVEGGLDGMVAGVDVRLIVENASEVGGVYAVDVAVGGGGAGAEEGGAGFGADGEFGALGGDVGDGGGEAGGEFALDVDVPLLEVGCGEVGVDGEADGGGERNAIFGAFIGGDGRGIGEGG